jgi:hypothetical protein
LRIGKMMENLLSNSFIIFSIAPSLVSNVAKEEEEL